MPKFVYFITRLDMVIIGIAASAASAATVAREKRLKNLIYPSIDFFLFQQRVAQLPLRIVLIFFRKENLAMKLL